MTLQTLGSFVKTNTGFIGRIKTLHIDREMSISRENQQSLADYRIHTDCSTLGYGWDENFDETSSRNSEVCIRLEFTEPVFDKPFIARLVQDKDGFKLVWRIPSYEQSPIKLAKLDQKTLDKWNALKRRNREGAYAR